VTSVLPALLRGDAVIVKPSLRGPLSPVAVAWLASEAGLPAGVLNIVQGTGVDVGAELISRRGLSALHVRASGRTLALAERGHARTNVPLFTLRGGGNAVVIGPRPADLSAVTRALAAAVRMNSAGGPFGIPLIAVHAEHAGYLLDVLPAALAGTVAAPLPSEPARRAAVRRIGALAAAGAKTLLGGSTVPDDIAHRMGWRLPPTVLHLGAPDSPAAAGERASEPAGPVLSVLTWRDPARLRKAFGTARATDGTAFCWGFDEISALPLLPHGLVIDGAAGAVPAGGAVMPQAWFGGRA
jgi:acyl-CoA reductase-like NAD-dependent aldehyde dehydrogenase